MKALTKRQQRRKTRGCDGKERYLSIAAALTAKTRLARTTGRFLHVYPCRLDKGAGRHWHLGHA